MADQQMEQVRAVVVERLLARVDHYASISPGLTDTQLNSPREVALASAETLVARSTIPEESRAAAVSAMAGMLTERFDALPAELADWRANGRDVNQEARWYGASLGDEAYAGARVFERHPPAPLEAVENRGQDARTTPGADPAIPPLRKVEPGRTVPGTARRPDDGASAARSKDSPAR